MKTYFKQLFDYDHHANHQLLKATIENGSPQKAVGLLAHLLRAQQVWLPRCLGDIPAAGTLWPEWPADAVAAIIDENHARWIEYLNSLNDTDFEKVIPYKTMAGVPYEDKLLDIFSHVINHGTHHRAQIGQQLLFAGAAALPATDLIFYLRDNK